MTSDDSATPRNDLALLPARSGLGWGFLGVLAFSFTVPFTRVAVEGLSPLFIGAGRAVVAAVLAAVCLAATRQRRPSRHQWARLLVVGGGVVVGFPLLTSFALTSVPASHGAVVIAMLPAATAVTTVVRTGERPPRAFWLAVLAGAVAALVFASVQDGALEPPGWADLLLVGAVLSAAVGYAEGGLLSRELGAWQTVSWALVGGAPLMLALTLVAVRRDPPQATPTEWAAFAYLGGVSMFLGFFAWYRGLAVGPMSSVSQVQLVQSVLTLTWAGLLLGERLTVATLVGGLVVIGCAAGAVRVRLAVADGDPADGDPAEGDQIRSRRPDRCPGPGR
ncbi:DMT family transporter [Nocardioides plantarum]|uniref:DMT family transporter n=1 Tax=Nocardioides plantarum TaxID=29299 RepID=A0ABV5K5M4_9ACTN|nr:DMT family transporter [Nocardioides plantarum]